MFRAPRRQLVDGADVTLEPVASFTRPPGTPLANASERAPCTAPQIDERQGEAVGFAANGASYFTVSEGAGTSVHRFAVRPPLAR